ncbi:MAG: hypothetical protein KKD44_25915 [Proteobacteria bacterium]|nr:hypothetical protein [Pseudomonadota bacterium]
MTIAFFRRNAFKDYSKEALLKIKEYLTEQLDEAQITINYCKDDLELVEKEIEERG